MSDMNTLEKFDTTKLEIKDIFKVPPERLYDVLTDKDVSSFILNV